MVGVRFRCWLTHHEWSRWGNPWQVKDHDPGARWQFRKCSRCGKLSARDLMDSRSW
jgi:hypothetical protein